MIEGFFDDSGKESNSQGKFVCLAGYIANEAHWYRFNEHWRHLLLLHGISAVHLKDWVSICARKGWEKPKGDAVLVDFINVIKEHRLIGFGVGLDADCWRRLPSERRKSFGNAQEFCFQRIIHMIVDQLTAAGIEDVISFVFDQDEEYSKTRLSLFWHIKKIDRVLAKLVTSITFANATRYYPLQAADILAWETRRELVNRATNHQSTRRYVEIFSALPHESLNYQGEYWDQSYVDRHFSEIEARLKDKQRSKE